MCSKVTAPACSRSCARRWPKLAAALLLATINVRSMGWMLEAAGVSALGPFDRLRAKGLLAVWLWTLRAWRRDTSDDLGATMAALDQALTQAGQAANWLAQAAARTTVARAVAGTAGNRRGWRLARPGDACGACGGAAKPPAGDATTAGAGHASRQQQDQRRATFRTGDGPGEAGCRGIHPHDHADENSRPLPNANALLGAHKRNMEALSAANRITMEGAQTVAKRHMEIIQQTMAEMTETMQALASSDAPQAKVAKKQTELLQRAYQRAVANTTELSRTDPALQPRGTGTTEPAFHRGHGRGEATDGAGREGRLMPMIPQILVRCTFALLLATGAALAQTPQPAPPTAAKPNAGKSLPSAAVRIVAVVNGDVVSATDAADLRRRLFAISTGQGVAPEVLDQLTPQVTRELIDEKLRLQEVQRRHIVVADQDIAAAIGNIEQRNNMPAGGLRQRLAGVGIDIRTLIDQVRVQIGWAHVVHDVLGRLANVSDAEVKEQQDLLKADIGKPEFRVAEIFVPVTDPSQAADAQRFAETW